MDFFKKETVVRSEKGKSPAFFCKHPLVQIDKATVEELKKISADSGNQNVRICLHEGSEDLFHDMVILQRSAKYYRPHMHREKIETIHLMEGSLKVFVFDESGEIVDVGELGPDKGIIYRIQNDFYHTVFPTSSIVIYHESKPGPFLGDKEFEFSDWAPDDENSAEAEKLIEKIAEYS